MASESASHAHSSTKSDYVGRFAPSPTGPLHLGSLVAAVASYLDARHYGGRWLLRIEDIDPPREQPGATAKILDQLRAHGLRHDGELVYQSTREAAYLQAIDRLAARGQTYFCCCSRTVSGHGAYPGTCRTRGSPAENAATRVRIEAGFVDCRDLVHGEIGDDVAQTVGDFVIRRRDGLFAYQLAVVVDDAEAGITHVVRGADLLDNTPRQVALQRLLGLPTPAYLHVPVVVDAQGNKLSKQNHAAALSSDCLGNLRRALALLGQSVPSAASAQDCEELLQKAAHSWHRGAIPRILGVRAS